MKCLALFLDGTWNDPDDKTNVCTLERNFVKEQGQGERQISYYANGVGVTRGTQISGGAFGVGLSANILDAYRWLVSNYDRDDKIFLFGFSRGAYTARSLGGMIARCGLLSRGSQITCEDILSRYKLGKDAPRLDELIYIHKHRTRQLSADETALLDQSHRVEIEMLGVWDTVGALGIPWDAAPIFGPKDYYFHNTNPSSLYKNCFQALAVDEHRGAYSATLWTDFISEHKDPAAYIPRNRDNFEQRWFIGAHANVGGGYPDDPLRNLPMAWIQSKAEILGLRFYSHVEMTGKELDTEPTDSFKKFLHGLYRIIRLGKRFYRPIGAGARKVTGGWSVPINEAIDASVLSRWNRTDTYRPKNLQEWASKSGVSLKELSGDQAL